MLGNETKKLRNQNDSAIYPQFQYSNNGMTAKLFSDATLECFFSGYDPLSDRKVPQIKWFDDVSNEITAYSNPPNYSISPDGRKLTIKNIQERDEKNFYCQGTNNAGQSAKQKVFLNVISAPIFLTEGRPKDITRPEDKDAVFNCHARSLQGETPPGEPEWFINGLKAGSHLDPKKYQFSDDKTKLTVMKLSKATDIQCVQCKVSNQYGTIWGNACLNVILPITVTNDPKLHQEIKKGDIVNLTVTATTDPSETLAYKWEFNNETYPVKPPHVTYNPKTYDAYINTSLLTQEEYETIGGVYYRILSHANDQKVVAMEVILKD
ncbi:neural cell adhesion molecule l1 [Plakobranchus ocellatus]|uniref:Neural cell adhesion molecule l1 n=1 Tax=Plakobranchus ocellatus TaxID=259542 RepID=A0AAV4CZV4_9GAST|nr:neural cell adhesion molecule l1 [Plakobranchus ocellatus]